MANKIIIAQAGEGLIQTKMATGLSPHVIADYKNTFKKIFLFFDGEIPLQDISRKEMVDFFAWLQEDYIGPMNSNYLTVQASIYIQRKKQKSEYPAV